MILYINKRGAKYDITYKHLSYTIRMGKYTPYMRITRLCTSLGDVRIVTFLIAHNKL